MNEHAALRVTLNNPIARSRDDLDYIPPNSATWGALRGLLSEWDALTVEVARLREREQELLLGNTHALSEVERLRLERDAALSESRQSSANASAIAAERDAALAAKEAQAEESYRLAGERDARTAEVARLKDMLIAEQVKVERAIANQGVIAAERDAALAQLAEASQRYAHRVGAHEAALVQLAAEKARADEEESHTANDYAKDEKLRRALAERTPWPDVVRVQLSYDRDDGAFHVEGGDAEGNGTFIADALIEWLHYSATAGCNPRGDGDAATERAARERAEVALAMANSNLVTLASEATRDHAVAEAARRYMEASRHGVARKEYAELLAAIGGAP